ncbi:MAG: hypothetical protein ABWX74_08975 [Aeromicrobium sp.]
MTRNDVGVGHALLSTVEPDPGHESAYDQWLTNIHFFDGVMHAPWVFSGRRWEADGDLLALRAPAETPVLNALADGRRLSTFWIAPGHLADYQAWAADPSIVKVQDEVVRAHRRHVYTAFHDHLGTVASSPSAPSEQHALIDPAPGLVLQTFDAPTPDGRDALARHLLDVELPDRVLGSTRISSAMVFAAAPPHAGLKPEVVAAAERVGAGGRRLTVLWFLAADPMDIWPQEFADAVARADASGLGQSTLVAPYRPARFRA